ncbi:amidase [Bacillus sp. PS06]|uniref:amidase n=1 Tax=Bacillus sp. PS06 TaxID=2764176 RepID=UPI00177FFF1D|nr:amidase [Bacillus sp. PS06]MBD8070108.1 amidase [Bacillus sp. PS06]
MEDRYHAYMNRELELKPTETGSLDGFTFSVKDVFAIKGHKSSAGNPDYLRTHEASTENAPVIEALLQNGATLKGTTHTDELMYSLNGENAHYGTPVNPKAPDHIPGGSSSGSAVAAASGVVDFTLGTDTGGSVRIPSSYCGIFGVRPTHGAVEIKGVIPLADSFDTVGWMASDLSTLVKVGKVIIDKQIAPTEHGFSRVLYATDAWERILQQQITESLHRSLPVIKSICPMFEEIILSDEGLDRWANAFRILQAMEIWEEHKDWVEKVKPTFGPGIKDRFEWASTLKKEEYEQEFHLREKVKDRLYTLLGDDGILVIPTAPGGAPLKNLAGDELEDYRSRAMQLTCIAGLAGLPQVTLPIGEDGEGKPVGLSFIGNRHQDLQLLQFAQEVWGKLNK